jgi:hypothetical protein
MIENDNQSELWCSDTSLAKIRVIEMGFPENSVTGINQK